MDIETASPTMPDPSAAMFHKAAGGNIKDSKLINSGRDTSYCVHNNYNIGENLTYVIGFFQIAVQLLVAFVNMNQSMGADGRGLDEVEISSMMPPDPSSLPVASIADVYTRSMLRRRVGYPLYEPDPFSQLSKEYTHNGVNVGDVGFIREDGAFDFIFNICPPQNSFINPPNLPDGFSLESPEDSETRTMKPLPRATRLFPPTVTRTISGEYICEGAEGAVLELPEGAIECVAINNGRFADLAKRHGVEWYEYTKFRGRGISNGSLYLVTSFTKCTQWAIGVFDRPCDVGHGLTFVSTPLGWESSGGFTTKTSGSSQDVSPNQCVLLRGYKIMIRQDIFDNLPTRQQATRIRGGGTSFLSKIKKLLTNKSSSTRTTTSAVTKSDKVVLHANFTSPPVHPSDLVNAALLSQNPDARVALTHDDVWCDLLRNNFPKLNKAELMNIARLYTSTTDEYGCVSLEKISGSRDFLDKNSCPLQGTEAPAIQGPLFTPDDDDTPIPAIIFPALPHELVEYVLLLLDIESMLACRLVNREFNEIIQSSTPFQNFLARQPYPEEFDALNVARVGFCHVEGLRTSLSNLYKSSIDSNRWKVSRISLFKSTRNFEHESLMAEVVCGRVTVYLRFERRMHKSGVGQLFKAGKPSKATQKTQTSDDSVPSQDNAPYSRNNTRPNATRLLSLLASDEVTYSKVYTDVVSYHDECIENIRFPEGKGLSLPQIVVLACCVNSFEPNYSLVGNNGSWFVHVMGEAAKQIETDFTLEKLSKRKRGAWKGMLTTNKPKSAMIQQIKTIYDKEWAGFIQEIHDAANGPDSEIDQEALQREQNRRAGVINHRDEAEHLAAETV